MSQNWNTLYSHICSEIELKNEVFWRCHSDVERMDCGYLNMSHVMQFLTVVVTVQTVVYRPPSVSPWLPDPTPTALTVHVVVAASALPWWDRMGVIDPGLHKKHPTLCGKSVESVSIYQKDSGNLLLLLALFGVVKVLCEPSSIWITSPAKSLVTSSGLESSVKCTSPMQSN